MSVANNGRVAVETVLAEPFDVILMDCQMPEMDGFEASRRITDAAASGRLQQRPWVIALTANAMQGDRERCLAASMDGYVSKPLDRAVLMQTIEDLLASGREPTSGELDERHGNEDLPIDPGALLEQSDDGREGARRVRAHLSR